MKIKISERLSDRYVSPMIIEYAIHSEGVLCASGVHDPLEEDDEWADLLN